MRPASLPAWLLLVVAQALDVAGNEDSNLVTLDVNLDCADTIQRDGGLADSGGHDAGGTASQSKGCVLGGPCTTGPALAWLLLVGLAAAARRARRRQDARGLLLPGA